MVRVWATAQQWGSVWVHSAPWWGLGGEGMVLGGSQRSSPAYPILLRSTKHHPQALPILVPAGQGYLRQVPREQSTTASIRSYRRCWKMPVGEGML